MKIKDLFENKSTVISLEIFPPKMDSPIETVYKTIEELKDLNPDYISVTFGAGGSSKDRTVEIASKIKNDYQIEALAHLTCISSSMSEIRDILGQLKRNNIENILALRGDMPESGLHNAPEYHHAKDLILEIKEMADFSVGAACYPEGHIECESKIKDIKFLKMKEEAGADFFISQLFFDNELFYRFMDQIDIAGINLPVSAGIMPVLNSRQIGRILELSGCSIPVKIKRILEKYENNPEALKEAGEAYAIEQIIDLIAWGVRGIHLYTMNKSDSAKKILGNITKLR